MDLKIDYAFKQLFGNEENKSITIAFLNTILQQTGRSNIKDILILFANTESNRKYADDKQSRMDLLVVNDKDEWVIQLKRELEMFANYNNDFLS